MRLILKRNPDCHNQNAPKVFLFLIRLRSHSVCTTSLAEKATLTRPSNHWGLFFFAKLASNPQCTQLPHHRTSHLQDWAIKTSSAHPSFLGQLMLIPAMFRTRNNYWDAHAPFVSASHKTFGFHNLNQKSIFCCLSTNIKHIKLQISRNLKSISNHSYTELKAWKH